MSAAGTGFVVVVPVKSPGVGKSRLGGLDGIDRSLLAAAFATDTVTACLHTDGVVGVLVVTEDAGLAATLTALGADTCGDGPLPGLNPALRHGAAVAAGRWPDAVPVALLADLPALRAEDLAAALAQIAGRARDAASYVVDADGTGTTLYAAPYDAFDPHFGVDSAAAHAAAGAIAIEGELLTLRRDVDDVGALWAAADLGVGTATRALLGGHKQPRV